MNNNDISYFMNMISNMDKKELAQGIDKLNQILSPEDKQKFIMMLNQKK